MSSLTSACPSRIAIVLLASVLMVATGAALGNEEKESPVHEFLRGYLKQPKDNTTRYSVAPVRLDGTTEYVLAYITGRAWCGSGGCTALLLAPEGASFKVIDRITLARLPIVILGSRTNGWSDIAMPVRGGGILQGYTAILKSDGHEYRIDPSVTPKLATKLADAGTAVPLLERGDLL
jgi:hypothetical protein